MNNGLDKSIRGLYSKQHPLYAEDLVGILFDLLAKIEELEDKLKAQAND